MQVRSAAARRWLAGALTAVASGGVATAVVMVPSATAASDPCAASQVSKTAGSVAKSTGEYLDAHPETNDVMSSALQQQPGPQTLGMLKTYFDAHPGVQRDFQKLTEPLTSLTTKCRLPVSLPDLLGGMQGLQGQGAAPGVQPQEPGRQDQDVEGPGRAPSSAPHTDPLPATVTSNTGR